MEQMVTSSCLRCMTEEAKEPISSTYRSNDFISKYVSYSNYKAKAANPMIWSSICKNFLLLLLSSNKQSIWWLASSLCYLLNVQSTPFGACLQDFAARHCVAQSPGDSFELHIMSQYNMSWPYSMGRPRQIPSWGKSEKYEIWRHAEVKMCEWQICTHDTFEKYDQYEV